MATSSTAGTPASPDEKITHGKDEAHIRGPPPPKDQAADILKYGEISGGPGSSESQAPAKPKEVEAAAGNVFRDQVKSFLSGGFGGVCAVLVGQPFDLTKTRLQTAPPGMYTGALDVVKKTLARDGIRGFYRGMGSPLVGVTPMFAVSFWGFEVGQKIVRNLTPNRTDPKLSTAEVAFAGFFSAIPMTLIAAPVERVKVLLQIEGQGENPKYKGPIDTVRKLYAEGGIKSIYRGSLATVARDGPGSAAYFVAYDLAKFALTPKGASPSDLNFTAIVTAGGLAGMAMWSIAIPPDTIKSRLQGAPNGTYSGFLDCAVKTVKADGIGSLFKGFGPAMLRAFPANAATFLGVEVARKTLNGLF